MRPRRLKLHTYVDNAWIYHVYLNHAAAVICPFISSFFFPVFTHYNFSSHFSEEQWGLEGWNLVHTRIVGRCIMHTGIRLLLHSHSIISSYFFLTNFQTLKVFVTLFSGTVMPRRLKLGIHVDSGQMYRVYQNQAAALICPFISLFIFLSNFQTLQFFVTLFSGTVRPWRLQLCTHVDSRQMYHVYWNQATATYSSLYFFIFLSGTVRPRRLKPGTHMDSGQMYRVYRCTGLSWPLGSLTPGGQDTRGQLDPRGLKFPGVSSPRPDYLYFLIFLSIFFFFCFSNFQFIISLSPQIAL